MRQEGKVYCAGLNKPECLDCDYHLLSGGQPKTRGGGRQFHSIYELGPNTLIGVFQLEREETRVLSPTICFPGNWQS